MNTEETGKLRPRYSGLAIAQPNPIICGRRFCARCGKWRHVCDFGRYGDRFGQTRIAPYCHACRRAKRREPPKSTADRKTGAGTNFLPIEPIRDVVKAYRDGGGSVRELAELTKTSERQLLRMQKTNKAIHIDIADRVAIALGMHLDAIYPYEEAA